MAVPYIEIRELSLQYPNSSRLILENISIQIEKGEFVCLVGASGSGKSTLLSAMAGFLLGQRGEIRIQGEPIAGPHSQRIFVFQESGLFPWLSVEDNIALGCKKKDPLIKKEIIEQAVAMIGLKGFEKAFPRTLSGGMRQRVEIARALAAEPEVIFMDEPFGSLDYLTRIKIRSDLLSIWKATKKTIIFVTHDIDEAVQLGDRVVILGNSPASIQATVPITLPRPRVIRDPEFQVARERVLALISNPSDAQ